MPNDSLPDVTTPAYGLPGQVWLPTDWYGLNLAVALSGGADSMALLCVLHHLKQQLGGAGSMIALHVNHQLRGPESDEDAAWCQQQCDKRGIPIQVLPCDTLALADEAGEGLEVTARRCRYQLLADAAEQAGVRYLATAHTRDDQVETVLFRMLRGTGLHGMEGIPRTRSLTPSVTLVRPLLDCSRLEVVDYLLKLSQSYRTDSSNADCQFARNRIRHELLPLLRKQYNPNVDSALLRLATQASEAQSALEVQAAQLLDDARLNGRSSAARQLSLRCDVFFEQENVVVCEALRIAWREVGLAEQAMTYAWWNKLAELLQQPCQGEVYNLPGDVRASIDGKLFLLEW